MLLIYDYEKQHFAPWLLKSNILVWLVNAKNLAKAPSSMGGNWRASRRIIIIKWLQLLFFFPSAYSHGSQLQSTLLQKRSSCVVQAVCLPQKSFALNLLIWSVDDWCIFHWLIKHSSAATSFGNNYYKQASSRLLQHSMCSLVEFDA